MRTDEDSRRLIVEDTNSNYFVEASAGSGKTYSLVLRMVAMIEGNDAKGIPPVPVDQICTITFTKAAAAEFFSRFQQALSLRSVSKRSRIDKYLGPKTKETMERCRIALENIDLCFLGTIDAFCNMIAHELPTELGVPSDSVIISNDDEKKLLEEAYEAILKDDSHPCHKQALLVNELYYKPRDLFVKAASHVAKLRNCVIPYDKDLVNVDINAYFPQSDRFKFLKYVEGLCTNNVIYYDKRDGGKNDSYKNQITLRTLYPKINKNDWSNCLSDVSFTLKQIDEMEGFSVDALNNDLDTKYKLVKAPAQLKSNSKIVYSDEARKCFDDINKKLDNYRFAILFDLVVSIVHEVFDSFKDQGKLGFFDYLYYLCDALKKDFKGDRKIINHILKRHSRFLLDESQDTNPLQTELFFYLTGTNKNAADWTDNKPRDGSLFIVGDPKQSIYAFRNANVEAFNKVKEVFAKEDKVLILTQNFRSKEIVKEWFNESMNNVLNQGVEPLTHLPIPIDEGRKNSQTNKLDSIDGHKVDIYQGVFKYSISNIKEDPDAVAKFIVEMVSNPNKYIQVKNKITGDDEVQHITFGDIRVVPRSTNVKKYVEKFNEYHIPVVIEADIPFDKSQTLLIATDLACLLKTPSDKAALFKILYGDLFKLNDLDIIQMKVDGFKFDISLDLVTFSNKKHEKIIELLHDLWNETKGFSYSSTLLYVLNSQKLDIYSKIKTDFLEYTFYLIEKVKEKEEAGLITGVEQFKEYVNSFIGGDTDDNRTIRFKDGSNRVILANLHKVKGLQAPIVILCGPDKRGKRATQYVDFNKDEPVANISAINDENQNPIAERYNLTVGQQDDWDKHGKAEKERIEYVGATRAESVLIVADKAPSKRQSDSNYPNFNPWEDLVKNISNDNSIMVPDASPQDVDLVRVSLDDPLPFTKSRVTSTMYSSPSKKAGDFKIASENDNLDDIKEKVDGGSSTQTGTLIHRLMECLVSSRGAYDISSLIKQIINEYHADEYKAVLEEVANKMTSGGYPQKNSNVEQDILTMLLKAEEVYCETPFSYKKGNEVINGIIDLIYKDKDGYHIIDYKTNKCDDVLKLETEEYQNQLKDYTDVLQEMGIQADAHIYHIKIK